VKHDHAIAMDDLSSQLADQQQMNRLAEVRKATEMSALTARMRDEHDRHQTMISNMEASHKETINEGTYHYNIS
jgi:hypothetical protein